MPESRQGEAARAGFAARWKLLQKAPAGRPQERQEPCEKHSGREAAQRAAKVSGSGSLVEAKASCGPRRRPALARAIGRVGGGLEASEAFGEGAAETAKQRRGREGELRGTGSCSEGFEGGRRQSRKRKKQARKALEGSAAVGEGAAETAGQRHGRGHCMEGSAAFGEGAAQSWKETRTRAPHGIGATGSCSESFEGGRRQSWIETRPGALHGTGATRSCSEGFEGDRRQSRKRKKQAQTAAKGTYM